MGGVDTVFSSVSFTLGFGLENLTLTGAGNINGTGNGNNNVITGNSANNILDGGLGADTLNGGDGSDTYYVDNAGDVVTEYYNDALGGVDTVFSSVSFTLGFGLENLTLIGAGNINGTGNGNNNVITGNSANNILDGGLSNDTLKGGAGNDTLNGGAGSDTADYSQLGQSITLSPTGIVTKAGGLGNDQLIQIETIIADANAVNNTIDVSTAGNIASINVNLQTQQLTVNGVPGVGTFTVTNFDNVKGTNQNDTIIGDAQNNQLFGNGGNDTLTGGLGADTLTGGLGADTFVFNSKLEGIDIIKDFQWTEGDQIQVGFATSLNQFSYNALSGNLSFLGNTFAVIENKPAGFAVALDVVLV